MSNFNVYDLNEGQERIFESLKSKYRYDLSKKKFFRNNKFESPQTTNGYIAKKFKLDKVINVEAIGDIALRLKKEVRVYLPAEKTDKAKVRNIGILISNELDQGGVKPQVMKQIDENGVKRFCIRTGIHNEVAVLNTQEKDLYNLFFLPGYQKSFRQLKESICEDVYGSTTGKLTEKQFANILVEKMLLHPDHQLDGEVKNISFSKDEFCYKYFDESILIDGDISAWEEFLCRIGENKDDQRLFMAWTWSVFEPQNKGRQVLVLKGNGSDGKSCIANAITSFIGRNAAGTISRDTFKNGFGYSRVFGKTLLVYGDCKNKNVTRSEAIHSITGGDTVSVEMKGMQPFSARVYAKVIIATNVGIEISDVANETSRLIYLEIKPNSKELILSGDNTWEERLVGEIPHFLFKCREAYKGLCPKHGNIQLTAYQMNRQIGACESEHDELLERFMEEEIKFFNFRNLPLSFTPDFRIIYSSDLTTKLQKFFEEERKLSLFHPSNTAGALKRLLEEKYEVKQTRKGSRRGYCIPSLESEDIVWDLLESMSIRAIEEENWGSLENCLTLPPEMAF